MSEPHIKVPVDLANPGQFFACCGLLELADRLWPGAEGCFEPAGEFVLWTGGRATTIEPLCKRIIDCPLIPLIPEDELKELNRLNKLKTDVKRRNKAFPKSEESVRKRLSSKAIASGFQLGMPFNLRVDWWLDKSCDGDHLKTWAGRQVVTEIADAMKAALTIVSHGNLFEVEKVIFRQSDGNPVAPLSFDAGRVGTAQDIGYSPDKVGQPIACSVWTEFLTLVSLQRYALKPDSNGFFTCHYWRAPLPTSVAAVAARGLVPQLIGCTGRFRMAARESRNQYMAFQQATLTEWRPT